MDRNKAIQGVAALVSTARDVGGELITGHAYAALMDQYSHGDFMSLVGFIVSAGLATQSGDVLVLTPKGVDAATKIDAAYKAA